MNEQAENVNEVGRATSATSGILVSIVVRKLCHFLDYTTFSNFYDLCNHKLQRAWMISNYMSMKLVHYRFDDATIDMLYDILIAKAHASGKEVAHGTYAPRHNGLNKSQVIRDLITDEWQRLSDDGSMTRARIKRCSNCGRTDCAGGYFCGY
jgi:hypothetical protein